MVGRVTASSVLLGPLGAVDGAPARDLDDLIQADREARRLTELKATVA